MMLTGGPFGPPGFLWKYVDGILQLHWIEKISFVKKILQFLIDTKCLIKLYCSYNIVFMENFT